LADSERERRREDNNNLSLTLSYVICLNDQERSDEKAFYHDISRWVGLDIDFNKMIRRVDIDRFM
jgi:hypothetical protein